LEDIIVFMRELDKQLRLSESSSGHLGLVFKRWIAMAKILQKSLDEHPWLIEFLDPNDGMFMKRYSSQIYYEVNRIAE
jgi:hypothetical protein